MMLEELERAKKSNTKAMDVEGASKVKTEPGMVNEIHKGKAKSVDFGEVSVRGREKGNGKVHAPVIVGGVARHTIKQTIYLSSDSGRSILPNMLSVKVKGKAVGVFIGDESGRKREKGKGKGQVSGMADGVARPSRQESVYLSTDTVRNRESYTVSEKVKGKAKAVDVGDDTARMREKGKGKGEDSGSVYRVELPTEGPFVYPPETERYYCID